MLIPKTWHLSQGRSVLSVHRKAFLRACAVTLQTDCVARVLNGAIGGEFAKVQHEIPLHKFPDHVPQIRFLSEAQNYSAVC